MKTEEITWLFLAVILGTEYGLKQLFENLLSSSRFKPQGIYLLYRLFHWVASIFVLVLLFSSPYSWWIWPVISLGALIVGLVELLANLLGKIVYLIFNRKSYFFHLLPMVLLISFALTIPRWADLKMGYLTRLVLGFLQSQLGTGNNLSQINYLQIIAVFILLAHATNYLIRWLICKKEDKLLSEFVIKIVGEYGIETDHFTGMECAVAAEEELKRYGSAREAIRVGRIIGVLERWLILILALAHQLAAIGFVLTAKSIARFKDFEKADFAEYYLVGTLYSVIFALFFSIIFLNI